MYAQKCAETVSCVSQVYINVCINSVYQCTQTRLYRLFMDIDRAIHGKPLARPHSCLICAKQADMILQPFFEGGQQYIFYHCKNIWTVAGLFQRKMYHIYNSKYTNLPLYWSLCWKIANWAFIGGTQCALLWNNFFTSPHV